jgi:RimJ/RimL family protein N-acetyltransferase
MPRNRVSDGEFSLEAVQPGDIEPIRRWRNSQLDILRQSAPISPAQQQEYFERNIWPTMSEAHPRNILLAFRRNGDLVGYGGLVHIAWEHLRAEVSFLVETRLAQAPDSYAMLFSRFLRLLKEIAFEDLGLGRVFAETYAFRAAHIAVLESEGFRREGNLRGHVIVDGARVDSMLHGCLRDDVPEVRS